MEKSKCWVGVLVWRCGCGCGCWVVCRCVCACCVCAGLYVNVGVQVGMYVGVSVGVGVVVGVYEVLVCISALCMFRCTFMYDIHTFTWASKWMCVRVHAGVWMC